MLKLYVSIIELGTQILSNIRCIRVSNPGSGLICRVQVESSGFKGHIEESQTFRLRMREIWSRPGQKITWNYIALPKSIALS